MRIAFVCTGNICRSPMAESVTRVLLDEAGLADQVQVESFGISGYHAGEVAHRQTDPALARHGWPYGDHRARQINAAELEQMDLVLCADLQNLADVRRLVGNHGAPDIRLMRSFDPSSPADAEVPDPWGYPDEAFDESLEIIERACRGLVAWLLSDDSPLRGRPS